MVKRNKRKGEKKIIFELFFFLPRISLSIIKLYSSCFSFVLFFSLALISTENRRVSIYLRHLLVVKKVTLYFKNPIFKYLLPDSVFPSRCCVVTGIGNIVKVAFCCCSPTGLSVVVVVVVTFVAFFDGGVAVVDVVRFTGCAVVDVIGVGMVVSTNSSSSQFSI